MHNTFADKIEALQSCDPPFSFYELVESLMNADSIRDPLRRFCTLMRKMKAHSFIQETLIPNEELLGEKEMAEKVCGGNVELLATRITFFCLPEDELNWDEYEEKFEKYLLAYAVVVTLKLPDNSCRSYILEAVVRPPSVVVPMDNDELFIKPITNYYVHNVKEFKTTLGIEDDSKTLKITGSFFSQQNSLTNVCAHAALRMAINSSPLIKAPKVTNKYINDVLDIDYEQIKEKLKNNIEWGLDNEQIETAISALGCAVHSVDFLANTKIEYDLFLYPALESCLPTILGVQGWNAKERKMTSHVVTVLGHTINSDRWSPEAHSGYGNYPIQPYISSARWCDHYIISDDNYGMYSTLPSDMLRNFIVPTKNPYLHAAMAVTIIPKGVTIHGYVAEQSATKIAKALVNIGNQVCDNPWLKRMQDKDLVCRTLLQTKEQYLNFIRKQEIILSENQQQCFDELPDYLWVSEIGLPNVYTGNKHKLGDVVIRANTTPEEHVDGESLALAWLPGFIQLGNKLSLEHWGIDTHIPLIRNAEDTPFLEW